MYEFSIFPLISVQRYYKYLYLLLFCTDFLYKALGILEGKTGNSPLCEILKQNGDAVTTLADRRFFAKETFGVSSAYDSAIFNYFDAESDSDFRVAILKHNNACGIAFCSRRPSSLIGRCRVLFFSFLYLLFLFFARKAEPEVVVAVAWSAGATDRHTTAPRNVIAAATTAHTAGTRRRSLWVAL